MQNGERKPWRGRRSANWPGPDKLGYEQVAPLIPVLAARLGPAGLVTRQQVFLAAKTAIAAGLACWRPRGRSAQPAVLRAACCAPVVQPTVYDSLSRAFQRVAG